MSLPFGFAVRRDVGGVQIVEGDLSTLDVKPSCEGCAVGAFSAWMCDPGGGSTLPLARRSLAGEKFALRFSAEAMEGGERG
jgi:hypothetical protein